MITRAAADALRAIRADGPAVLSVYLNIPLDLAAHRALPARGRELIRAAATGPLGAAGAEVRPADPDAIARVIGIRSQDWLGHTAAFFACADLGLLEVVPLPGYLPEIAVVATKPHVRPLLAAMQRHPDYRAALVDTRHAWVLSISDDRIETVADRTGDNERSTGFSGWWGLEGHRMQQRVMMLSRQHFRDTIAILERAASGGHRPLVLGGQEAEINQFMGILPRAVARDVAGTFHVDLRTATPGRVRELAAPVLAHWAERHEARLVADLLGQPPQVAVVTDLAGCLAAAREQAIAELVIPDGHLIPGYRCDACGALGATASACDCPGPAGPPRGVPDLLEELADRTLDDGGEVTTVREPPFAAAARLRFPVRAAAYRAAATGSPT